MPTKDKYKLVKKGGLLLILLLAFSQYFQIRNFTFLNYDDNKYVVENPDIQDISPQGIKKIFLNPHDPQELKPPLAIVSLGLNYAFGQLNPTGYFISNLCLHLANIYLVFFLISALTTNKQMALFVTAAFAFHPSSAEAVAWVTSRKEVLYTFFYLLALLASFKFWKTRNYTLYLLIVILFFLSFFSKFSAATFPILYIGLALIWKKRKDYMRIFAESIPMLALPVYSFFIAIQSGVYKAHTPSVEMLAQMKTITVYDSFSFFQKIQLGGYAFFQYLLKFIYPFHQQIIYPYPLLNDDGTLPAQYPIITVVSLCIVGSGIYLLIKNKALQKQSIGFGITFFLITVFILLQVLPIGGRVIIADRYTYLPYIGLSVLLYGGLEFLSNKFKNPKITPIGSLLFILLLLFQLNQRIPQWANSETIFKDMIEKEPNYPIAYNNLANLYAENNPKLALDYYTKAILLDNKYTEAYNNRGATYIDIGQAQKGIKDLNYSLSINPNNTGAHYNIARGYERLGQVDKALSLYLDVLKKEPTFANAANNIGVIYLNRDNVQKAQEYFKEAIRIYPNHAMAYNNLGLIYNNYLQNKEQAAEYYIKAAELNPNYPDPHLNLGGIYLNEKKYAQAITSFSKTLKLNPNLTQAYLGRGLAFLGSNNKISGCKDLGEAQRRGSKDAGIFVQQYCR